MDEKTMRTIKYAAEILASLFSIAISAKGLHDSMAASKPVVPVAELTEKVETTEQTTQ